MKPKHNQSTSEKERRLRDSLQQSEGATFISYDPKSFKWEFRVEHFTKWGEEPDEDMDDQNDQVPNIQYERSAFEGVSDQASNQPPVQRLEQPDIEMNAGIPQLMQQSVVEESKQSNSKQRKIQLNES